MKTGLYIHYPFCLSKCAYCDFNSVVNKNIPEEEVLEALIQDLNYYHELIGSREIDTIYFGGGTPSLMSAKTVGKILIEIYRLFKVKDNAEITLEANPVTAEIKKFGDFKKVGINRLSIGIQSFSNRGLKALNRNHDVKQSIKALEMSKQIFDRSSFDLIYGWEGQTLKEWEEELKQALQYEQGHLSIYQLTVYQGTALAAQGGKEIGEDASIDFQQMAIDYMKSINLMQYEISNYAQPGQESQHNLIYWHYDDYIGIGAGASGRLTIDGKKKSFINKVNIKEWLTDSSPIIEELSNIDQAEEYLLMGLRLNQGINISDLKLKTGVDIESNLENKPELSDFITIKNGYVLATEKGRNCLNALLLKLL